MMPVFNTTDVPEDVLQLPRVVTTPAQEKIADASWMRLGDVPSKPNNFPPSPVIEQAIREMQFDRAQGQKISQQIDPPALLAPSLLQP